MPIIIPKTEQTGLQSRLISAGAAVINQEQAEHQDIRPARIALLNLMPAAAMEKTETQWLRYMSHSVLQIEPLLMKFDDDYRERKGGSREEILSRYTSFSDLVDTPIDGLIITGDNLEIKNTNNKKPTPLPFEEINYYPDLICVMDWANHNVHSTIYSCLASHIALCSLYDVQRNISTTKTFGVFKHAVNHSKNSQLVSGLDDVFTAPHSRWGYIDEYDLVDTPLDIIATSSLAGWLLATRENANNGCDVFIQGHPEYDRNDLMQEHQRDNSTDSNAPVNYYDQNGKPILSWANDARALHSNWINMLYKSFSM